MAAHTITAVVETRSNKVCSSDLRAEPNHLSSSSQSGSALRTRGLKLELKHMKEIHSLVTAHLEAGASIAASVIHVQPTKVSDMNPDTQMVLVPATLTTVSLNPCVGPSNAAPQSSQ